MIRWIVLLGYAIVGGYLSLQPPGETVQVGGFDKLAHLSYYTLFGIVAAWAIKPPKLFYICALLIVAYSALLELGQSYIPGREMSGWDLVANATGVVLAMGLRHLFVKKQAVVGQ